MSLPLVQRRGNLVVCKSNYEIAALSLAMTSGLN
jgi:hypothetical protein